MNREEKMKKLLKEVQEVDEKTTEELQDELRTKLQELIDKKLFPKGYSKIVAENLGISYVDNIYHTISGKNKKLDLEIAAELIRLAKNRKESLLIKEAEKILKS